MPIQIGLRMRRSIPRRSSTYIAVVQVTEMTADGDARGDVEHEDAERVASQRGEKRSGVDEQMALLHCEIEAQHALAIGWHRDGEKCTPEAVSAAPEAR